VGVAMQLLRDCRAACGCGHAASDLRGCGVHVGARISLDVSVSASRFHTGWGSESLPKDHRVEAPL
jgi:hypothetical protein